MHVFVVRRFALIVIAVAVVLALVSALSLPAIMTVGQGGSAIIIDPGHGGIDGGAYIAGQVVEKDIVLDISLALRDALADTGRTVRLTRDRDIGVAQKGRTARSKLDLASRLALARRAGGAVLVSIHANYCRDQRPRGPIVFYKPGSTASQRLAQCIHNALAQFGPQQARPLPGQYYILRNSHVPAVLVEVGFISNAKERALLKSSEYRARVASAVARGVRSYLNGVAVGDGRNGVFPPPMIPAADAPATSPGTIPVYFPLRGGFALARSIGAEASLPVMAGAGGDNGVELLARSVLARLLAGPDDGARLAPAVPAGTNLQGVHYHDGLLSVDLSPDMAAVVGDADEYLTVYALVNSLCGIPGVRRVQILVDGQKVETLAGHVDIEQPVSPLFDTALSPER